MSKPSILGCAIGFGMAGSAVGLLTGLFWFGTAMKAQTPEQQALRHGTESYGYILTTIPVGVVAGAGLGIVYARRKRSLSKGF